MLGSFGLWCSGAGLFGLWSQVLGCLGRGGQVLGCFGCGSQVLGCEGAQCFDGGWWVGLTLVVGAGLLGLWLLRCCVCLASVVGCCVVLGCGGVLGCLGFGAWVLGSLL